ncbi:MAG TPA: hypothetical protein VHP14_08425 [Anaerolineales bacterium]|nr:hypothetical protein [Anaerolineales bacterium]
MNFIDRYVAEIGRHLPEKDRTDIEAEIRSMIEDMLDERGHNAKSADDKAIAETLEELGDPRLLASRYAPPRHYLIGPGWYEIYIKTLQRVLFTVLPILAAVTIILTLAEDPLAFGSAVEKAIGSAFDVGLQIWFWMTIVFVFMERSEAVPNESLNSAKRTWTADQLPELPRARQISIGEVVMDIAMVLFVMVWIVLPMFQGDRGSVPFLNPDLWNFWLPILLILLGLTLIHDVFQLKIGNWTPALTITNVILGMLAIVYLVVLVTTQDLVNPAFLAMLEDRGASRLIETARWSVNISAAIIAGIYVWDMVNSIRLARQLEQKQ